MESYEREIPLSTVRALYGHQVLTDQLVASLNKELRVSDIKKDAIEIGYPV
jgi:hypothetical protein